VKAPRKKLARTYEVTLRRDVQQVTSVRVQAYSPKEAAAVAESVTDEEAWNFEQCIGTHRPEVQLLSKTPIKGRQPGKSDRRDGTDRRATRRRLGDKSKELVAARTRRTP
jgi:hypothetical protein